MTDIHPTTLGELRIKLTADRRAGAAVSPARHRTPPFDYFPTTLRWGITNEEAGVDWQAGHHTGEDHACPVGSLAVATSFGRVLFAGSGAGSWGSAYGTLVVIRTRGGRYDYMLCHLSAVRVKAGEPVVPGQVVGFTGESGNVTGPHLHFEARPAGGRYGSDVDPMHVKRKA